MNGRGEEGEKKSHYQEMYYLKMWVAGWCLLPADGHCRVGCLQFSSVKTSGRGRGAAVRGHLAPLTHTGEGSSGRGGGGGDHLAAEPGGARESIKRSTHHSTCHAGGSTHLPIGNCLAWLSLPQMAPTASGRAPFHSVQTPSYASGTAKGKRGFPAVTLSQIHCRSGTAL